MSAAIYCPICGYPNDAARGACLMCYANVRVLRSGAACPSCGGENPKTASFCMGCQAALAEGAIPQMLPDISGLVGAAVGGAAVVSDEYASEPAGAMDFGMPEPAHADFDTADEFADFAAPPPPPAAADTGAEAFTPPPAPPSGGFEEEEFGAPPPPPDTVDLDLDLGEAPPPAVPKAAAPADTGGSADDLGDWSLDYDE